MYLYVLEIILYNIYLY